MFISLPKENRCICSKFYILHNLPSFFVLPGAQMKGQEVVGSVLTDMWRVLSGPIQTTVWSRSEAPHIPVRVLVDPQPIVCYAISIVS